MFWTNKWWILRCFCVSKTDLDSSEKTVEKVEQKMRDFWPILRRRTCRLVVDRVSRQMAEEQEVGTLLSLLDFFCVIIGEIFKFLSSPFLRENWIEFQRQPRGP